MSARCVRPVTPALDRPASAVLGHAGSRARGQDGRRERGPSDARRFGLVGTARSHATATPQRRGPRRGRRTRSERRDVLPHRPDLHRRCAATRSRSGSHDSGRDRNRGRVHRRRDAHIGRPRALRSTGHHRTTTSTLGPSGARPMMQHNSWTETTHSCSPFWRATAPIETRADPARPNLGSPGDDSLLDPSGSGPSRCCREHDRLAWASRPTSGSARIRLNEAGGLARRLVGAMVAEALPAVGTVRYRALVSNVSSIAVAQRLGFQEYGRNYRARRRPS